MVKSDEKKTFPDLVLPVILGAVIGFLVTLLLLFIFSIIIIAGWVPAGFSEELIIVAAFAGATIGSVFSVKKQGRAALPTGVACGAVYLLLILLITALGPNSNLLGPMTLKNGICAIGGGLLGAVLCSRPKRPKSTRRWK